MDKKLRDEWVKALRSGEYEQGRLALQVNDAYCCMGVLCKVGEKIGFAPAIYSRNRPDTLQGSYLTAQPVGKELPIGADDILSRMNDSDRKSFPEIADWIERHIPVDSESNT